MSKTDMLYMKDNYIKEFQAKVLKTSDDYLVLDQTAFYPEGGGQESDKGRILYDKTSFPVHKVKKKSGGVRHYIKSEKPLPPKGAEITGELDWERRFTHMQYHTAIHILSKIMQEKYDAEVVGNNISTRNGRADFDLDRALEDEELEDIEKELNKQIKKSMSVSINFMPRAKAREFLEKKGYQTSYIDMVPDFVKNFRIISINDYDHASCAGTHVKNTAEIGDIEVVKRRSMGKNKERVILQLK
ncbi:MAG: alanyl-tRNA editing protein [Asgard group archaeon]|nr:alanyl-tRNA editing protein [Asgard group archaeon]